MDERRTQEIADARTAKLGDFVPYFLRRREKKFFIQVGARNLKNFIIRASKIKRNVRIHEEMPAANVVLRERTNERSEQANERATTRTTRRRWKASAGPSHSKPQG